MVSGLAIFHYLLPIPLTLIDFHPVTFNLRLPIETIINHVGFGILIVVTHKMYTVLASKNNIFRNFLRNLNYYRVPDAADIWITGWLGLLSCFYNYFVVGVWGQEVVDRGVIFYVTTALAPFICMPVLLLFPEFINQDSSSRKRNFKFVVLYMAFVAVVAVTSNWRTVLFSGIFMVAGLVFIGMLLNFYDYKKVFSTKKIFAYSICFVLISGPISDLAQAMVYVRHERYEMAGFDFLKRTIDVYNNKDLLDGVKQNLHGSDILFSSYDWDEHYINNAILNRLVSLKISDNCIFYAEEIGWPNKEMQREFKIQLASLFPNIILPYIGISYEEKIESARYSIGDYLYGLATNRTTELGSNVLSAMPGVGLSIFGLFYIPVIIALFLIIFAMYDSFVDIKNNKIVFSYMFFVMLIPILDYFNDRHVYVWEFRFILRTYFEGAVVFLLTMIFVRIIKKIIFFGR
jgi:hypothetical protein